MTSGEKIIATLRAHKDLLKKMGVRNIGVFGSYVRDDQTNESDIDILIDFDPDKEKFDTYMAICDYLEKLFQEESVDIVTKNGLSPYIGPKILEEVVYV
ncbi:MAG: nucleotidyltransferase family protein [Bacteroidales bacterium]|nr:nucleotidyltransferase family protein [Bacteroidales bacterium]